MNKKTPASQDSSQTKTRRTLIILVCVVLGMFAFGFALVPIYNVFCKVTGLNGKIEGPSGYGDDEVDLTRTITVQFVTNVNGGLSWKFYPEQDTIRVHPGEITRVVFYAENNSPREMTVQAIPSVSPGLAARYLHKTECFCFTTETFKPHEKQEMPVLFHLDAQLPKDIHELTLSYTMYDASKSAPSRNVPRGGGAHIA
jgi:cytochrome c oxidase assembly protein subunit 11